MLNGPGSGGAGPGGLPPGGLPPGGALVPGLWGRIHPSSPSVPPRGAPTGSPVHRLLDVADARVGRWEQGAPAWEGAMNFHVGDAGFVHLHAHSAYSLLEGALKVADLAKLAVADRMPALALTDANNMFGALEFAEKMVASGVQPIAGLQLTVDFGDRASGPGRAGLIKEACGEVVLLASTEGGLANLLRLTSRAHLDAPAGHAPHVPAGVLEALAEGLILLTGGPSGPVDRALAMGLPDLARARLNRLAGAFQDRAYVEVQRHDLAEERAVEGRLLDLAYDRGVPLVATNQPYFAKPEGHEAHDALLALAEGRVVSDPDRRRLTPEHGFKSRAQMQRLFKDLPEACQNTLEVALRCAVRPRTRKPMLPRFAAGGEDEAEVLRARAEAGLVARLAAQGPAPGHDEAAYAARLAFEVGVISRMNYAGYFLIVADFIREAKSKDIPVGPGRGSGAGSLVAYALTITDVDPLRFDLLFERFLNPDRVSMPDFDIDFCQERRGEVIEYVRTKYGADRVASIITFGSLLARGVMRDVGRVLEMPYGQVDKLTKLVPVNPTHPVTLKMALAEEPKLQAAAAEEPVVARMLAIAQQLEGLYRHASTHAAGVVIADRPLEELVPLYRDPRTEMLVTQYNMKWVEPAGLVKFDFLGLKTLSVLQKAVELLRARGIEVDLSNLPLGDPKTYAMLARGEVVGVFQVESGGMRRALIDMKADRIEDLIALVALYRPGPMANIPVYCERKLGAAYDVPHPTMRPILEETFGVIVYQEQVMQVARVMAGYSLSEADLLRRAMGKKIKAEMDAQRARFVTGAVANKVPKAKADEVFDLLAKFADYGFNKSHAAAYALVSFQTAYLKANFPVEFLAASMSFETTNTDKLAELRQEAERMGIDVLPPCINRSGASFDVVEGRVLYALCAVRGIGGDAAKGIVAARADGPFADVADFARRVGGRGVNKRVVEALAASGAFDGLKLERAAVHAGADAVVAFSGAVQDERAGGQSLLFGEASDAQALRLPKGEAWSAAERLRKEYEAVGFFLTGHPLDEYGFALARARVPKHAEFLAMARRGQGAGKLAATVLEREEKRTKSGGKMGVLHLSDQSGPFEAVLFQEGLAQFRDLLEPGATVLLGVVAMVEGDEVRLRIGTVERLDAALAKSSRGFRVFLRDLAPVDGIASRLGKRGEGEVSLVVMGGEGEVEIRLPGKYDVGPAIAGSLKALPGVVEVQAI